MVLLYVRHHRATEGWRADAWADGICRLQPSVRPDAGIHFLPQVARGAASVLLSGERLDCEEAWQLVERHRVTNMFTVPTILTMLTRHDAVDRYDHSSLRYVIYAGSPMYRADQVQALKKLGKVLVQYFGMGEVTGNITVLPPALHSEDDAD